MIEEIDNIMEDKETLYCVGCGRAIAKTGKILAISCVCGALAPILHTENGQWVPPASFMLATGVMLPHLEYYLGFSTHQSSFKTDVTRMLRAMGSISYTECKDVKCRESYTRKITSMINKGEL